MNAAILDAVSSEASLETAADHALSGHGSFPTPRIFLLSETGEAAAADEAASALLVGEDGRPDPQWVRGRCPECGDDLISNMYFSPGNGYIIRWECWSSRGEAPQCSYQRVL